MCCEGVVHAGRSMDVGEPVNGHYFVDTHVNRNATRTPRQSVGHVTSRASTNVPIPCARKLAGNQYVPHTLSRYVECADAFSTLVFSVCLLC